MENLYHWIARLRYLVPFILLVLLAAQARAQCNCDFTVPTDSGRFNGNYHNVSPGDVICLDGDYGRLRFENIQGTETDPVIIRNCGGIATVYSTTGYGWKFVESEHFVLSGDGTSDEYGIKVTTEKGFYLTMELFTTDFEIFRVEVAGIYPGGVGENNGFAGIGIKTSPYQDCELFEDPTRQAWIMRNIYVHDNYIHDTGGEGIYMGHGFYNGRIEKNCTDSTWSHSIKTVRVYNNRIENVAFDGIQIKNADEDVQVYDNYIINVGRLGEGAHDEGLFMGSGSVGEVYDNIIINVPGWGFDYHGLGKLNFYNNIVVNTGKAGFYLNGNQGIADGDTYIRIINNTLVKTGEDGIEMFQFGDVDERILVNNIIAEVGGNQVVEGSFTTESNNLENSDANQIGFVQYQESSDEDFISNDYHLSSGSVAIDSGMDASIYNVSGVDHDLDGNPRPYDNTDFDIGAYEYSGDGGGGGEDTLWTYFVNTGGFEHSENDTTWIEDRNSGENCSCLDDSYTTGDTGGPSSFGGTNPTIAPSEVLGSYRYASGSNDTIKYKVAVPEPGEEYEVTLFFATKNAESLISGERRFDIIIEGVYKTTYDIYDNIGDSGDLAGALTYTVQADDTLEVVLASVSGSAMAQINALSLELLTTSSPPSQADTVTINTGGGEHAGTSYVWEKDLQTDPHSYLNDSYNTYTTGSTSTFSGTNNTGAPDEILGSYRYTSGTNDTIKYEIPVSGSGNYDIDFYFAFKNADNFTSGDRYFNIIVEGQVVTDYDVYDEAGTGASSYQYAAAVSDGTLNITIAGISGGDAQINAMKIVGPVSSGSRYSAENEVFPEEIPLMRIYPNPANEFLNFTVPEEYGKVAVQILDLSGKIYLTETLTSGDGSNRKLDISGLRTQGIYLLKVVPEKGPGQVFRFIRK